jgi:hypothetical protein
MDDYGTRAASDLTTRSQAESVVERVYLAVKHLCTARGDVRQRLVGAVSTLLPLQACDFPAHLQEDFDWIVQQSTKYQSQIPKYQGNLDATMKRIRNSTGEKIAERIFNLYADVQAIRGFPLLDWRNPKD